ncbi:MAG: hypothetical protein RL693_615 [Verrucomicrobiota bacterium]|jgi:hypothetical protein
MIKLVVFVVINIFVCMQGRSLAADLGACAKEISDINVRLNNDKPLEDPELVSLANRLSKAIPSKLTPGLVGSSAYVLSATDALMSLQFQFSSSELPRSEESATALATATIALYTLIQPFADSNFTPLPAGMNVVPPPGSGIAAGGSPAGIGDPVLRKAYEAVIEKNESNIRINTFHSVVARRINVMLRLVTYLLETPKTQAWLKPEINDMLLKIAAKSASAEK